ncbi:MAG: hypothetical protein ACQETB_11965 [Halobacteriota archaeon]
MVQRRHRTDDDRLGFDETTDYLAVALSKFVPNWLAKRAVTVSVSTDRDEYERGEPVDIVVEFTNRLPIPVEVPTPQHRLWGWTVDGLLEATDENRHIRSTPARFAFRGGERKRIVRRWHGRFRRVGTNEHDGLDRSVLPEPGEYEITAFLAVDANGSRPEDSVTVTIR